MVCGANHAHTPDPGSRTPGIAPSDITTSQWRADGGCAPHLSVSSCIIVLRAGNLILLCVLGSKISERVGVPGLLVFPSQLQNTATPALLVYAFLTIVACPLGVTACLRNLRAVPGANADASGPEVEGRCTARRETRSPRIAGLTLPRRTLIVLIRRRNESIIPRADTVPAPRDSLLLLGAEGELREVEQMLTRRETMD